MTLHARPTRLVNQNWFNAAYWLSWLALAGALFQVIASYGIEHKHYTLLHNSDAMFIPVFYRDILMRGSLRGWDLPTNPYFFPDMAIFIPILTLVANTHFATILYAIAQLLLLITGMVLLQRHLFGANRLAQTVTILALTLSLLLIATGQQVFHAFILMSVHHTGVLVMLPFATVALLRVLQAEQSQTEQRRAALLLFGLTLVLSLSDSLFIIQFVLPALAASLLWRGLIRGQHAETSWRHLLWINGGMLLSAAAGQGLRQMIVPVSKFLVYANRDEERVAGSFANFRTWISQVVVDDPLFALLWLTSLLALIAVAISGLRQRRNEQDEARWFALVATLFFGSMVLSVLAAIVSGNFEDMFSARYLLPTLYLPLLAGWPLLLAMHLCTQEEQKEQPQRSSHLLGVTANVLALTAIVYVLYTLNTGQPIAYASLASYKDPLAICLEREAAQRQIRHGLAGYWQADSVSARTQGALNVVPVGEDLSPIFWNNNPNRYQALFDFVIIQKDAPAGQSIGEKVLLQKFGQPAETFECESSKIYVYNRPSDVQIRRWFASHPTLAKIEQVGDVAEFYGYALPSAIGGVSISLSQGASEQWGNNEGLLAYASLPPLPAGRYAVAFDLFSGTPNTGAWEVISFTTNDIPEDGTPRDSTPDEAKVLQKGRIEAPGQQVLSSQFDLQQEANVEIRVQYAGHGTLFVDRVRLARIDPAQVAPFEVATSPVSPADAAPEGTLSLIHPYAGGFVESGSVDFAWRWTGQPLPEGQTFEVRLWRKGETIHFGAHDARAGKELIRGIDDTYIVRLDLNGAHSVMQHGAGEYEWTVGIVEVEPEYRDLQIEAPAHTMNVLP